MVTKLQYQISLSSVVLLYLIFACNWQVDAKESNQQPLGNLDKVLQQVNGTQMTETLMDAKLASNMTNALNEMAMNLRKMFAENRRLTVQVQDVIQRVQNATGVNSTTALGKANQQALLNLSNPNSINNLLSRFQVPRTS